MGEIMEQAAPPTRLAALPTGTVTFLFTDIEGSTTRWEQFPAAMQAALDRHDAILRAAIAAAGGAIIQTGGDSFVAAFPTAHAALAAALRAQHALAAEPWTTPPGPLGVRMALHTGPAEVRAGSYHAEYTLNRAARLLAAGYGGQVLLSDLTRELLRQHLPADVSVRDLGSVRLKDLLSPLHVYQLLAPDLPAAFPPLKTLDAAATPPAGPTPGRAPLEPPAAEESNPYKGLRAFQEADAADFFGREALTARLVARLAEAVPLARFLVVVGPSGSGKSSVVRAGLVPALHAGALPGSAAWPVLHVIPGAHPLEELDAALLSLPVPGQAPASLLDVLQSDERGLTRAVKRVLPRDESSELVLVIDQFEEIFTLVATEPERVQFLASLCAAAADPRGRVRIIATLRADFYDRPLLYPDPGELVRQRTEVVLPLTAAELYQAITAPARRVGVTCEPELVTAIIGEVGEQPGTLPLLQYALTELFERRVERTLTLVAYRETGGVLGALARRAEETYAGLTSAEQALARQIFLRLVTLGEGVEDTRRRVHLSELESLAAAPEDADVNPKSKIQNPKSLEAVLETFGRYRLLTFDRDPGAGGATVEVAHEALLRTWPRLREWLDTSRADLRVQRQLLGAAREWAAAGQDPSFLATGARLAQFGGLASAGDVALTSEERAYLAASVAEQERVAAEETTRQAHELELARNSAAAQRSAAQRLRVLLGGAVLFLIVAMGLSFFAFDQSQRAQNSAATAVARQTETDAQRQLAQTNAATAVANGAEANTQRQLAQANAATAVANGADAQGQRQVAEGRLRLSQSQRLAAEANSLLAGGRNADLAALLSIRSMTIQYSPAGDVVLETAATQDVGGRVFGGHATAGAVLADFSPDGRYILTSGTGDNTARLWDAQTGVEIRDFVGHSGGVRRAIFSPDGTSALTTSDDKTARLWAVATGRQIRTFVGHTDVVGLAAFSPDGHWLATGSFDKTARLWDVATGQFVRQFVGHADSVVGIAFSPDGKTLLTGSWDKTARLWDVATGREIRRFVGHTDQIYGAAFSPDGKQVLTGSVDKTARLWDVASGQFVRAFVGHTAGLWGVAFSPDGHHVLTGSWDRTARLWDAQTGVEVGRFSGHDSNLTSVEFSPDGEQVLTGGGDSTARLWAVHPRTRLPQFVGHEGEVYSAVFAFDGRYVLTAGADKSARLWDPASGQEIRRFTGHTDTVNAGAVFSPDDRFVLTGSNDETVRLWDAMTGRQIRLFPHAGQTWDVRYAPDGKSVLTGAADGIARLWDPATGRLIRQFSGHTAGVNGVAFSPDGRTIATGSLDKTARLWDLATGQAVHILVDSADALGTVRFSPDGRYLVAASFDKTALLWDVATGRLVRRFVGHTAPLNTAVISADGRWVLTASEDGTARLWDLQTGQEVRRFFADGSGFYDADFSPGGRFIITASHNNTARLWDLDYHTTIEALCGRLSRDLTDAERAQYGITDTTPTCPAK